MRCSTIRRSPRRASGRAGRDEQLRALHNFEVEGSNPAPRSATSCRQSSLACEVSTSCLEPFGHVRSRRRHRHRTAGTTAGVGRPGPSSSVSSGLSMRVLFRQISTSLEGIPRRTSGSLPRQAFPPCRPAAVLVSTGPPTPPQHERVVRHRIVAVDQRHLDGEAGPRYSNQLIRRRRARNMLPPNASKYHPRACRDRQSGRGLDP